MSKYAVAFSRDEYKWMVPQLNELNIGEFVAIDGKDQLTTENLEKISPKFVFLPHWSHIISSEIHKNFDCVIFHMTDLPFGRGGSPLQNLIARGIYETKMSAIQCVDELDGGDVYLKRPLSLDGTATEILNRASQLIFDMIQWIVKENPVPQPQEGDVTKFSRRTPDQSNLKNLENLTQIYDYIRMLDGEGYPPAFLETDELVFEFKNAEKKDNEVIANVSIRKKH